MILKSLAALALMVCVGQAAQAMPVPQVETGSNVVLVRDGCGRDMHAGPDGYCHQDRRNDGDRIVRDLLFRGDRHDDRRYREREVCPRGYHMGQRSGVCRPNDG